MLTHADVRYLYFNYVACIFLCFDVSVIHSTNSCTQDWEAHMLQSHADGTFFAAGAFYTFHANKDTLLA